MRWTSIVAIYTLFWTLGAFLVMPFGVRTPDELGLEKVPGQAHSAPANFNPRQIVRRATVVSLIGFVVYYQNYLHHWITIQDLDLAKWLGWY
jgi:predicted secreted protein